MSAAGRTAVLTGVVLAAASAVQRPRRSRIATLASIATSVGAVVLGRTWGLTWRELGLDPRDARRGSHAGLATIPPIATVLAVAALSSTTRPFLADDRVVRSTKREAAYQMLVRIPVVTAAGEELVFRGVLLAVASTWLGSRRALAYSSLMFGVWHVLPAIEAHRSNPAGSALADRAGGRVATVAATVAATTAAGVALGGLRLRTRSVLAPFLAHLALNELAFATARMSARRRLA